MRLINVETFKLEEFFGDAIPKYAILSHTWGNDDEEITFRDIEAGRIEKSGSGSPKVKGCCNQAKQDGLEYVWIDTCCIDKTSAVELGESINSMFHWYRKATVCYAYLFDVPAGDNPRQPDSKFFSSRWFTRGWTLQELLAPKKLCFYDHTWDLLGTKHNLSGVIQTITGVPRPFLLGLATLRDASIAQRMSWAAKRRTKREEDLAYCLLGIFGVMMPMIYGEGDKAFVRLQEEIMKHGGDDSILAWGLNIDESGSGSSVISKGILAAAPSDFATCGHIVSGTLHTSSIEISGGRLKIHLPVHTTSTGKIYGLMKCQPERDVGQVVGVPLEKVDGPSHSYIRPIGQRPILLPRATPNMTTNLVSIGKDLKPSESSRNRQHWFYIEEPDGIDLELIDVEPRARWRKDQAMIATEDTSDVDAVQRTLTRFRSKRDMSNDIVIVLECYSAPVRVLFYAMSLSNDTPMTAVSRKLDYLLPKAAGKRSVSTGAIHVAVSVREESIAGQSMFVVSLTSMPDAVEFSVDASSELRVLDSKTYFVKLLCDEESLTSTVEYLDQQLTEQETAVREKKGKISAIREMISQLQKEERLLVEELRWPAMNIK
ncbi:heterokaryon incompatibility protein-domain-containing protein, partial [Dactylonectria macrodidyma]